MGIQSMVKSATCNIMRNNSSNAQTGRLWTNRLTEIAADLEIIKDHTKDEKIQQIISDVAVEFNDEDIQSQIGPVTFMKRQQSLIQADAQLDQLKAPPSGRDIVMKEAMKKDLKRLDRNLRNMCESSLPLIQDICNILPNKKSLKTDGISDEILAGSGLFSQLQRAMANLNQKLVDLQDLGYMERSMMVAIIQLEDPETEPFHWQCGAEETFGELLQKAFLPDPCTSGKAEKDEEAEGDSSDDDDDNVMPDVWIKRWDTTRNSVTITGQWWEHQADHLKVMDVLSEVKAPGQPQNRWVIEVVAKKGDYVVALVGDNGVERGKAVDLPNTRRRHCTTERICRVFGDRKVIRVVELQGGEDASQKDFNRFHYQPKTNPLYVELEAVTR